ncbi:unnamed protein product [Ilex paraguariensis]|uniref:CONSTANS-like protein n=1 Tax=Ilex paraguariensis TaxID=185542 RepID=A0ABC8RZ27_9AQUA
MGTEENGNATTEFFPPRWSVATKPCDYCKSAAAQLFCLVDSAFMCMGCDAKLHAVNKIFSPHARAWLCGICEQSPSTVTCKADAAALCVTCDCDIHSANTLACRHKRSPVVPFYATAETVVKSTAATSLLVPLNHHGSDTVSVGESESKTRIAIEEPWTLSNPEACKVSTEGPDLNSVEFLFPDSDHFLDLEYPAASIDMGVQQHHSSGTDSIVPVQSIKPCVPEQGIEFDFARSEIKLYKNSYAAHSLTHSVSSSSLEVGVVPDGSSISDISYPSSMDREARVLRYREKRKNRKFQKTIRYASRKAYAEKRPRIKGRFAKRNEVDSEIDHMFSSRSTGFMADVGSGVIPSF